MMTTFPTGQPIATQTLRKHYAELAPRPPEGVIDLARRVPAGLAIELEIGFGRGQFLFERSQASAQSYLLGIEVKTKLAYQVEQRRLARGLDRICVWAGDARETLARIQPDGVLQRAFIHFPDPWWKKRHHKRKVVHDTVIDQLGRLLAREGELFIQTDVEERALEYQQLLQRHPAFDSSEGWLNANPYGARSNRETRADQDGLPVWRLRVMRCM